MKAIITCAGTGKRLLSFTKELPKEMAPIFWKEHGKLEIKPLIELIFENLYEQGIREFCFITGKTKRSIENHFSPQNSKDDEVMSLFNKKLNDSRIFWITQPEARGFGDAVRYASSFSDENYFVLQAGDVAVISNSNIMKKFLEYEKNSDFDAVLLVRKVSDPKRHGIVTLEKGNNELFKVLKVEEKPEKPESDLGIMPLYLFKPSIFSALEKTKPGKNNEVQLTDAIQILIESGKDVRALRVDEEKFFDVGTPESYWKALQDSHAYSNNK